MKKRLLPLLLLSIVGLGFLLPMKLFFQTDSNSSPVSAAETSTDKIWKIQSIDTMKYSRDTARNEAARKFIPIHVKAVAETGANYIAIATPYDDEFIPFMKLWVDEARKYNLHVWFRGNFSGWEGWFDYPRFTDYSVHHEKTLAFITSNADLFVDGDIFTPAPELENGGLGDPRRNGKNNEFNQFLVTSYETCQKGFSEINKKVSCDYYSMNPDVLRERVTKETLKKIGGIASIDHYVNSSERMIADIKYLQKLFDAKIFLGEFGAPIPDINGQMTEQQQATFMEELFQRMYLNRDLIAGMNYWVLAGGSTSLLNDDNSEKLAFEIIKKYYDPSIIMGTIKNTLGEPIEDVNVTFSEASPSAVITNNQGDYKFVIPATDSGKLTFKKDNYKEISTDINLKNGANPQSDIKLEPVDPGIWYNLKLLISNIVP